MTQRIARIFVERTSTSVHRTGRLNVPAWMSVLRESGFKKGPRLSPIVASCDVFRFETPASSFCVVCDAFYRSSSIDGHRMTIMKIAADKSC